MVHDCMVYTERAEMAAVSCGTSHARAVSTPLRWYKNKIKKTRYKKLFTHVESHASAVSLLESGELRYIKKAINKKKKKAFSITNSTCLEQNVSLSFLLLCALSLMFASKL